MWRRTALTLLTMAGLSLLYVVYARTVGVLARPRPAHLTRAVSKARVQRMAGPPPENIEVARRYLPAWAARAKYQVRDAAGLYYYANQLRRIEAGQEEAVRFTPFALVWFRDADPTTDDADRSPPRRSSPLASSTSPRSDREPLVLIADAALIQFDSKFELGSTDAKNVVGGQLEGNVTIRGANGLLVQGRNLIFRKGANRVWTDSPVEFRFGPHSGSADRGLQVELVPSEELKENPLAFAGVARVLLRRHVVLRLLAEEKGRPTPVTVQCDGGFVYEVAKQQATFEDQVRVRRQTAPNQFDSLECDLLTLLFEPVAQTQPELGASKPPGSEVQTVEPSGREPASRTAGAAGWLGPLAGTVATLDDAPANLRFRRLVAEGTDVVLSSDAGRLLCHANELLYDAVARTAILRAARGVRAVHDASLLVCPEVTLTHDQRGKVTAAWCRGAGWLEQRERRTDRLLLRADWRKQLRLFPDPATPGLNVVELEQDVTLRAVKENASLSADRVQLWYVPEDEQAAWPEPQQPVTLTGGQESAGASSLVALAAQQTAPGPGGQRHDGQHSASGKNRPRRLLATGHVRVESPQIRGRMDVLEAVFVDESPSSGPLPNEAVQRSDSAAAAPPVVELTASSEAEHRAAGGSSETETEASGAASVAGADQGRRQTGDVGQRRAETDSRPAAIPPPSLLPVPGRKDRPLQLVAKAVRVRLAQQGKNRFTVSDVWGEGGVQVTQPTEGQQEGAELVGERLQLINTGPNRQSVRVFGRPARVRRPDFSLEGPDILLDRAANLLHVNGPGTLTASVTTDFEGRQLPTPQPLTVRWDDRMTFDGRTARFFGNITAELQHTRMRCHDLTVELSARVDFSAPDPTRTTVELQRVVCHDTVWLESYGYVENRLNEVRRARCGQFSLDRLSGATEVAGPGEIEFWRRGRGKRAAVSPRATARANAPLQAEQTEWEYTRVEFAGGVTGNLHHRTAVFRDRVRIVYGPVDGPLGTIDPDHLPKDAALMRCETLEFVYVSDSKDKKANGPLPNGHIELTARGNAMLEGRTFFARADVISYDESKGMYSLSALGRAEATIWRQVQAGGDYSEASAKRMIFIPAKNYLDLDRATRLHGTE